MDFRKTFALLSFIFCLIIGTTLEARAGAAAPTMSIASSPNPSTANQIVTFIATVVSDVTQPVGSVVFSDGGTPISGSIVVAGDEFNTSIASFTVSDLSVGDHSITAEFTGSGGWPDTTASAIIHTVNEAPATTSNDETPATTAAVRTVVVSFGSVSSHIIDSAIDSAISNAFSPSPSDGLAARGDGVGFFQSLDGFQPPSSRLLAENEVPSSSPVTEVISDADQGPLSPVLSEAPEKKWSAWLDLRHTGAKKSAAAASGRISGTHFNVTAGITRKINESVLVGLVSGFEKTDFDIFSTDENLKGNGGTLGVYMGWRFAQALEFTANLAGTRASYDLSGASDGSFNASQWSGSAGVQGTYAYDRFIFVPSFRAQNLWSSQSAWKTSAGDDVASESYSLGQASLGGKIEYPFLTSSGNRYAPFVGLYENARFSSEQLKDSWASRLSAGLGANFRDVLGWYLGADLNGLGADFKTWSVNTRVSLPF